jgi:cutinase
VSKLLDSASIVQDCLLLCGLRLLLYQIPDETSCVATMKYFPLVSVLTATAIASPVDLEAANPAAKRQSGGIISNDLQSGPCRPITFIFARGSTEPGNMVSLIAPFLT